MRAAATLVVLLLAGCSGSEPGEPADSSGPSSTTPPSSSSFVPQEVPPDLAPTPIGKLTVMWIPQGTGSVNVVVPNGTEVLRSYWLPGDGLPVSSALSSFETIPGCDRNGGGSGSAGPGGGFGGESCDTPALGAGTWVVEMEAGAFDGMICLWALPSGQSPQDWAC